MAIVGEMSEMGKIGRADTSPDVYADDLYLQVVICEFRLE